MADYTAMSSAALIFAFGDVSRRIGRLEEKQMQAHFYGIQYAIPPETYTERDELGSELFRRIMAL